MRQNDPLFELIKSLTKSEKRYFKVFTASGQGSQKDYLRLFDALDAQKTYDPVAIEKKFKDEPYFNQMRTVRYYLYRQIIKSLNNYHDEMSPNVILNNYMNEIAVLHKKQLYKNCANTIKKAKEFALKHEKWLRVLDLISWESNVTNWLDDVDGVESLRKKWEEEEKEVLKKYGDIRKIHGLFNDLRTFFMRRGYVKTVEERNYVFGILNHPMLVQKINSFEGETNRLTIKANCYLSLDMDEERFQTMLQGILFLESYPHQVNTFIDSYFFNLCELTYLAMVLKKHAYTDELLRKMDTIFEKEGSQLSVKNQYGFFDLKAILYLRQGQFEKAKQFIPQMVGLTELAEELNTITVHETLMYIYFCNADFRNAHMCIQKVIAYDGVRLDIQSLARIINLIVQYETGEYEYLSYQLRSTYRYLSKKQRLQEPEQVILRFLKDVIQTTSQRALFKLLAKLKTEITPYQRSSFLDNFPLIEWIDSKLENRGLQEIVRERYRESVEKEQSEIAGKEIS